MLSPFSNAFEEMKSIRSSRELVERITTLDAKEAAAASTLNSQEVQRIGCFVADTVRKLHSQSVLETGALLHLFDLCIEDKNRTEYFKQMELELAVSRTQLYRSLAAYRHFGKTLLAKPAIAAFFVGESLKLLSESNVPEAARSEAVQLAASKKRITIAIAKQLRKKHARKEREGKQKLDLKDSAWMAKSRKPKVGGNGETNEQWLWKFDARPLSICVRQLKRSQPVSATAIVEALESALKKAKADLLAQSKEAQSEEAA